MHPQNLTEWGVYIASLSGLDLRTKAIAANTLVFVMTLQEEGMSASDISTIFALFARRFIEDDQVPPDGIPGEYLSLLDLQGSLGLVPNAT